MGALQVATNANATLDSDFVGRQRLLLLLDSLIFVSHFASFCDLFVVKLKLVLPVCLALKTG